MRLPAAVHVRILPRARVYALFHVVMYVITYPHHPLSLSRSHLMQTQTSFPPLHSEPERAV